MSGLVQLAAGASFASDFKVVKPLAEGAMGAVYVVEQLSTKKLRALKLMQPELVASADLRRRFEREAQVAASIKSAHVVETIGAGVDAATGIPWLAMELLEGETLADRVERAGPLDAASLREVFGQLGHALGKAHEASIVHRDLKPENLFLAVSQHRGVPFTLKVLDFGIARIADEVRTTSSNTRGSIGTPLWWAPEQASPGEPVGPFTDVWPLGLIAFWACTGRYFWKSAYVEGASLPMMAMEQFVSPMPPASVRGAELAPRSALPPGFDAWFAQAVARDPKARFPSATEACAAFDQLFEAAPHDVGRAPTMMASASQPDLSGSVPPLRASSAPPHHASSAPPIRASSAPPQQGVFVPPSHLRGSSPSSAEFAPTSLGQQPAPAPFGVGTGVPLHASVAPPQRSAGAGAPVALIAAGAVLCALALGVGAWKIVAASGADAAAASATPSASVAAAAPSTDATVGGAATPVGLSSGAIATSSAAPAAEDAPADDAADPATAAQPGRARAVSKAAPVATAAPATAAPAPAPAPVAALGPPLTQAEIQKAGSSIRSAVKHDCWSAARAAAGKGAAKSSHVAVTVSIDASGNVTSAVGSGGDGFPGLAGCVANHARGLHFHATTPMTASLSFDLK